jgi:hypothetical protein
MFLPTDLRRVDWTPPSDFIDSALLLLAVHIDEPWQP